MVPSEHRLLVTYIGGERLILLQGENKAIRFCLTNSGSKPIDEVWMVSGTDDEIWINIDEDFENCKRTYFLFPLLFSCRMLRQRQQRRKQFVRRIHYTLKNPSVFLSMARLSHRYFNQATAWK